MSKSVRVDDDIHAEMKEFSNDSGIDISKLIELAWTQYKKEGKVTVKFRLVGMEEALERCK